MLISMAMSAVPVPAGTPSLPLYAKWKPITYSISYSLDGGYLKNGETNPETYTIEDSFTLNAPEKEGYEFTGWTGSNGATPQTSVAITNGSTGDKSYKANWKIAERSVTFTFTDRPGYITKVITYHSDGSMGNEYTDPGISTVMTAYAEGKVVLYHPSSRYWFWYNAYASVHNLGPGECCHCIVPSDASGAGVLCIGNGSTSDNLDVYGSTTGWCLNITSFVLGS